MYLLLARHGETAWNREGRYQGHTDVPLSPEGERQARALGAALAEVPIVRAVASPLVRARRTAELALEARGRPVPLSFEPALREISHGAWEGKLLTEIQASEPELLRAWKESPTPDLPAGPGAESLSDVEARAWPALLRAAEGLTSGQAVLLLSHDAVLRVLLCRVLGLPLARVWSFRQSPATLNVVSTDGAGHLQVVRLNDADHVAPFFSEAVHRAV